MGDAVGMGTRDPSKHDASILERFLTMYKDGTLGKEEEDEEKARQTRRAEWEQKMRLKKEAKAQEDAMKVPFAILKQPLGADKAPALIGSWSSDTACQRSGGSLSLDTAG